MFATSEKFSCATGKNFVDSILRCEFDRSAKNARMFSMRNHPLQNQIASV
jgi:hypothetical protein